MPASNSNSTTNAAGSFTNTLFRHIKKANEIAVRDLILKHYKITSTPLSVISDSLAALIHPENNQPLMFNVVRNGAENILHLLINEFNVSPEALDKAKCAKDKNGEGITFAPPFLEAARLDDDIIVRYFVEETKTDLTSCDEKTGQNVFHFMAKSGSVALFEYLLEDVEDERFVNIKGSNNYNENKIDNENNHSRVQNDGNANMNASASSSVNSIPKINTLLQKDDEGNTPLNLFAIYNSPSMLHSSILYLYKSISLMSSSSLSSSSEMIKTIKNDIHNLCVSSLLPQIIENCIISSPVILEIVEIMVGTDDDENGDANDSSLIFDVDPFDRVPVIHDSTSSSSPTLLQNFLAIVTSSSTSQNKFSKKSILEFLEVFFARYRNKNNKKKKSSTSTTNTSGNDENNKNNFRILSSTPNEKKFPTVFDLLFSSTEIMMHDSSIIDDVLSFFFHHDNDDGSSLDLTQVLKRSQQHSLDFGESGISFEKAVERLKKTFERVVERSLVVVLSDDEENDEHTIISSASEAETYVRKLQELAVKFFGDDAHVNKESSKKKSFFVINKHDESSSSSNDDFVEPFQKYSNSELERFKEELFILQEKKRVAALEEERRRNGRLVLIQGGGGASATTTKSDSVVERAKAVIEKRQQEQFEKMAQRALSMRNRACDDDDDDSSSDDEDHDRNCYKGMSQAERLLREHFSGARIKKRKAIKYRGNDIFGRGGGNRDHDGNNHDNEKTGESSAMTVDDRNSPSSSSSKEKARKSNALDDIDDDDDNDSINEDKHSPTARKSTEFERKVLLAIVIFVVIIFLKLQGVF